MRFDKLTQTIPAGGVWRLGMAAAELQIVASSSPLRVTLYRGGSVIGSGLNVLAGDYFRGVDFDAVELFSVDAQEVTILLTDGESGSSRIVGEVSVINGELMRVSSGVCFMAQGYQGGVAAEYQHVQLFNPAGSGRNVVVSKLIVISSVAAQAFRISVGSVAAAVLASAGVSKKVGGAASVAQIRTHSSAAPFGSLSMVAGVSAAYDSREVPFSEPILLPEGTGLIVGSNAVNVSLWGSFQWLEEIV